MVWPYVADRRSFEDAADLMTRFGANAGYEAAALADRSLDLGNHITFCHWRQIERLIVVLACRETVGTVQ